MGIRLTTLIVINTDCIGRYKYNNNNFAATTTLMVIGILCQGYWYIMSILATVTWKKESEKIIEFEFSMYMCVRGEYFVSFYHFTICY